MQTFGVAMELSQKIGFDLAHRFGKLVDKATLQIGKRRLKISLRNGVSILHANIIVLHLTTVLQGF